MPLVTRQANQGNIFNIPTEPTDWQDGDLWSDVGQNPPILKLNDNGTARPTMQSGILVQGDLNISNAANELGRLAIGTADQLLRTNSGATAPEWATIAQLWSVLGDYEATSAEASHNFNFTAVDFDDDSYLLLAVDGIATASFDLRIQFNTATTSNYFFDGRTIIAGTETLIDENTQTSAELASTGLITGADSIFGGAVKIFLGKGAATDMIVAVTEFQSNQPGNQVGGILFNVDTSSITDVTIITSTSTWKIGTRMTLYRVARA